MEFTKYAINALETAVMDVITPKANKYYKNRQEDVVLEELIEKEIAHIEALEDLVIDMTSNINFSSYEKNNSIQIDGYYFHYNSSKEEFEFSGDTKSYAKNLILNREGLGASWRFISRVGNRVHAILVTLDTQGFDEVLKAVEDQLDYNEIVNLMKIEV